MKSMLYRKARDSLAAAALIAAAFGLTTNSAAVSESLRTAVFRCINVMIPSLFAFIALTDLLVRSGGYIYLSYIFAPISRLLGLPRGCGGVFVMSNIGGYPIGASMISSMYDRGGLDKRSAARLVCVCYNSGPAFFSGALGLAVYGSAKTGLVVYLSVVISNCLLCAVITRLFPIKSERPANRVGFVSEMLPESVCAAGKSLFMICGMILIFAAITPFAEGFLPEGNTGCLLSSLLEISNLSSLCGTPYRLLPYAAAAGAFGGLCVMVQVHALVGGRFSLIPFTAVRAFSALLSWAICRLLCPLMLPEAVTVSVKPEFIVNFHNFTPSLCLIMMIFLTFFHKRLAFSDKVWYNIKG
ncbi:MAG: hypothetical protein K6C68_09320 [Ruminococcus sp.]|nr:hypothetical protein [Ruminococcus sp.]